MIVYALIGKSGSGKSHRAQFISRDYGIEYIIDDGLLISGTRVVAGTSAKREGTKLGAVKRALFTDPGHRQEVTDAINALNMSGILIIGTSDGMVDKIANVLNLPPVEKRLYIEDIATPREIELATRIRREQGKHVIPVPTFAIKKDFSGYFIDSIRGLSRRDKDSHALDIEKTVVRPTFSYLGRYTISNNVVKSMVSYAGEKTEGVRKVQKVNIENKDTGLKIDMDITVDYGCIIPKVASRLREYVKNEIEYMTAFNILEINLYVKGIEVARAK